MGAESNSNLILTSKLSTSGSEMLNNMVASFTASNQIGEEMKKEHRKEKGKTSNQVIFPSVSKPTVLLKTIRVFVVSTMK